MIAKLFIFEFYGCVNFELTFKTNFSKEIYSNNL